MSNKSTLIFQLTTGDETIPIVNATIQVYDQNNLYLNTVLTDLSGKTLPLNVDAPTRSDSLEPFSQEQPFLEYNAKILANGFIPVEVKGIQAYPDITSIEKLELNPVVKEEENQSELYEIPDPAITFSDRSIDDCSTDGSIASSRILQTVYIPSSITVHLGSPSNTSAQNVSVSFPDYIKNVASSEIYPTWPENAIRANIYAQISFALNRIFTEWYPSRGYDFNITNHTGYDQYFVKGRNIFENISQIVDEIFNEYVRQTGALNPMFTEYCNGTTATCNGLSQWGTVSLAQNGYSPLKILQYYYGSNIEVTSTDNIQDILSSYPGYVLKEGMSDSSIESLKTQLNRVGKNYPLIPTITTLDSTFDEATKHAVKMFQSIFNLTQDGIVGKATWNKLSYLYVAVLKLSELNGGMIELPIPSTSPTLILKLTSTGEYVKLAQYFLVIISQFYEIAPLKVITGYYGTETRQCVLDFQTTFHLDSDGIIGPVTWDALYNTFLGICNTCGLAVSYPGVLLKVGSNGDQVWLMQSYLQKIAPYFDLPSITADGIFGSLTKNTIIAFQEAFHLDTDGIIGEKTWNKIVTIRLLFHS